MQIVVEALIALLVESIIEWHVVVVLISDEDDKMFIAVTALHSSFFLLGLDTQICGCSLDAFFFRLK